MADLKCTIAGIETINPVGLASAPPTDKEYNVRRAFEAGWGGVVWKTLGEAGPPIVNVNGTIYANGTCGPITQKLQTTYWDWTSKKEYRTEITY